jgi:hypothetical protein
MQIPLHGRRGAGRFARVSKCDYAAVAAYRWRVLKTLRGEYAIAHVKRNGKWITKTMHQMILGSPEVDHKNGDGLNNLRRNTREATRAQNTQNRKLGVNNTTGFKGVFKQRDFWTARLGAKYLGCFNSPEAAARAYDREARIMFGKFVCVSFARRGERCAR